MESNPSVSGSAELHHSVSELLRIGRGSVASYRAAEEVVTDHRLQAALAQLRLDHERHLEELAGLYGEMGGEEAAGEGATGPVAEAVQRGEVDASSLLEAVRQVEAELRKAYESSVERALAEPIRTVLTRHCREEQAHVDWLHESAWWRAIQGERQEPQEAGG